MRRVQPVEHALPPLRTGGRGGHRLLVVVGDRLGPVRRLHQQQVVADPDVDALIGQAGRVASWVVPVSAPQASPGPTREPVRHAVDVSQDAAPVLVQLLHRVQQAALGDDGARLELLLQQGRHRVRQGLVGRGERTRLGRRRDGGRFEREQREPGEPLEVVLQARLDALLLRRGRLIQEAVLTWRDDVRERNGRGKVLRPVVNDLEIRQAVKSNLSPDATDHHGWGIAANGQEQRCRVVHGPVQADLVRVVRAQRERQPGARAAERLGDRVHPAERLDRVADIVDPAGDLDGH